MSLYNIAQPVGAMASGALQGALATNLNGVDGSAGWRWYVFKRPFGHVKY
jgi:ACS family pantothenate transporter-like MFS transporter